MPAVLLYGLMLILMLLRVVAPIGARRAGRIRREIRLSLRERLLLQRTNVYLLGSVLLLGAIGGWVSPALELLVILAAWVIVALPVRYVLTDEGVGLNNVVFRQWSQFRAVADDRRGLRLVAREGLRDFRLVLSPDRRGEVRREVERALASRSRPGPAGRRVATMA